MAGQRRFQAAEPPAEFITLPFDQNTTDASFNTSTKAGLEAWIYWHYLQNAFHPDGRFRGMPWFRQYLFSLDSGHTNTKIRQAMFPLLHPNHKYSLARVDRISEHTGVRHTQTDTTADVQSMPSQSLAGGVEIHDQTLSSTSPDPPSSRQLMAAIRALGSVYESTALLFGKTNKVVISQHLDGDSHSDCDTQASESSDSSSLNNRFEDLDLLLSSAHKDGGVDDMRVNGDSACIQHAPLMDAVIISGDAQRLVPQYGLLGSYEGEAGHTMSKLLLNTNVPFSMFICGVQGSGKSHTTSCVLENALVPSKHLGKLPNPLSALVFSYAPFGGDGIGFTVSEAAFLASPKPGSPSGAHVKHVRVLVPPSNFARISKLYLKLPNVSVTPFKIRSRDLDIDVMLTLMNVSASDETPLYMAQVMQILRQMSTTGGAFDYKAFKQQLKKKEFNPAQSSMLQMRLDLLESFLDTTNNFPQPHFYPGEITIMNMSCPFVDANTACILFRIGLKLYLQMEGNGKMIVLDEAHKYMLDAPGAKALNEMLLQTIRLQRHYGARVVISTQEPTLLTDLIALCSVTVIHRFSSPAWLAAIRRHIPTAADDRDILLRRIEKLKTGDAIVYSPNAVLGYDETGNLIMGTNRMIDVTIRKRLTSDGGQSVMAV